MEKTRVYLWAVVAGLALHVQAAFVLDTTTGGTSINMDSYTISFVNGSPSVSTPPASFNDPGLSGTLGDLSGSITFTFRGYGQADTNDAGLAFVDGGGSGSWSAGSAASTTIDINTSGYGINDPVGNGNLSGLDEGIFLQVSFSGIDPADVVLTGWDLANNATAEANMNMIEVTSGTPGTAGSGNILGTGLVANASVVLAEGKYFLMGGSVTGAGRIQSLTFDAIPAPDTIDVPTGLGALAGDSVVVLDWDDDTTGLLETYTVYRGTAGGTNNYTFSTNVADSTYTDIGLTNGTTYYYAVTASDTNGFKTAYSTELPATPKAPIPPPAFIHIGVGAGGTNLDLTWTSQEGEAFDLLNSFDLSSWSNLVEDISATSAATQTTHAVAIDAASDHQFFRVRRNYPQPPNIILLFADDLGCGDVACYGHPYAKTPNLDKLAEQGTQFMEFNVTGVTCNPSRTGLLTSWLPESYVDSTSTYGFNQAAIGGEDHPTVMELLNDAGYRTGHFGKWHIGPVETNGTYGIDEIIVSGGGGSDPRGRDEAIYQDAINFIEANQHTNFYINVMGRVTHNPVEPRADLVASAGYTNLYTYFDRNDFEGQQLQGIFDRIIANGGNITNSMANYLTEVYYLDQFIGELMEKLDELGIADNTIVAFSSDQGAAVVPSVEEFIPGEEYRLNLVGWSGGLRGQKHDQHEGGIRSPFILRWPAHVPAGKVNTNSVTSALDWLPTLCDIAGVDISGVKVQGESVKDIWKGSDRSRNDPQFWSASMKYIDGDGKWRIYFNNATGDTVEELYDLNTDLSETNNLVTVLTNKVQELQDYWVNTWIPLRDQEK